MFVTSCQYKFDNNRKFNSKFFEVYFNFVLFHYTKVILTYKTHCQILMEKKSVRDILYIVIQKKNNILI